jgi:uncharacterized protein YbbK (DUF523 family)
VILVSACLLGVRCRYDGAKREIPAKIGKLGDRGECLIPVCPEQLGGLSTPRPKNDLTWRRAKPTVIDEEGRDVTPEFLSGAEETLRIAKLLGAKRAIFKSRSPSCGEDGITTRFLRRQGIEVEVIDAPEEE